jgi:hypothetical protein
MWSEDDPKKLTASNDNLNDIIEEANGAVSEAAESAVLAALSESNAYNSEQKADLWANQDKYVEVEPGLYSAKHWALLAQDIVVGAEGVPIGAIMMWAGIIFNIPVGYHLCDGTNNTPDLSDRFVLGTIEEAEVGETGGSDTLDQLHLPSHTHGLGSGVIGDNAHDHGNGDLEAAASTDSEHVHDLLADDPQDQGSDKFMFGPGKGGTSYAQTRAGGGAHSHNITGRTASTTHAHGISGSTETVGSGAIYKPKYYKLAYIMRA